MLCDECKRSNAAVHLVSIINGEKKERHLCPECAKKLGTDSFMTFSWGDVFPTAFAFKTPAASARCPVCGTTLNDITRTGLLGCPACYTNLRSEIMPIIGRVQNRSRHSGRVPVGYEAPKLDKPLEAAPENPPETPDDSPEAKLRAELAEAVSAEEYERAAVLRDQLKSLTGGNARSHDEKKEG